MPVSCKFPTCINLYAMKTGKQERGRGEEERERPKKTERQRMRKEREGVGHKKGEGKERINGKEALKYLTSPKLIQDVVATF